MPVAGPAFLGSVVGRLDDQGRLPLPAAARSGLAQGAVLTRGHERCLYVYPVSVFESVASTLPDLPLADRAGRSFVRMLCSAADGQVPDRRSRLRLSFRLLAYAGLAVGGACMVVGVNTRVEIWEPARWERLCRGAEPQYAADNLELPPSPEPG